MKSSICFENNFGFILPCSMDETRRATRSVFGLGFSTSVAEGMEYYAKLSRSCLRLFRGTPHNCF